MQHKVPYKPMDQHHFKDLELDGRKEFPLSIHLLFLKFLASAPTLPVTYPSWEIHLLFPKVEHDQKHTPTQDCSLQNRVIWLRKTPEHLPTAPNTSSLAICTSVWIFHVTILKITQDSREKVRKTSLIGTENQRVPVHDHFPAGCNHDDTGPVVSTHCHQPFPQVGKYCVADSEPQQEQARVLPE